MKSKTTAIMGLIAGIVAIALVTVPIQAYFDANGDLLQTRDRDQDRLRINEQDCCSDMLQTQERERLRSQECDRSGDRLQMQARERLERKFATAHLNVLKHKTVSDKELVNVMELAAAS